MWEFDIFERTGTVVDFIRQLMAQKPHLSYKKAKAIALATKRIRISRWGTPHYGKKASARNLRHAKAGTHGLRMDSSKHIVFG